MVRRMEHETSMEEVWMQVVLQNEHLDLKMLYTSGNHRNIQKFHKVIHWINLQCK
jgi:hypothetical protein